MKQLYFLLFATLLLQFSACSQQDVSQYQDVKPEIILPEFFNGKLVAHGMVKNRSGEMIRYFSADIDGSCNPQQCALDEQFYFNDGELQQRQWLLKKAKDESGEYWIATANDVIGEHKLRTAGNAIAMQYVLRLQLDDGEIDINVDDRMYLIAPNRLINESTFTKFGFEVGSVSLMIEKLP
ncbi:MAG: DUF3833 domain-containing protein [Pseudomonadales bacterium]|nr:DUF3833 domain-containing protein [Pseudomonadales bacterium]